MLNSSRKNAASHDDGSRARSRGRLRSRNAQFTVEREVIEPMTDPLISHGSAAGGTVVVDTQQGELERLLTATGAGDPAALAELYDVTVAKVHALVRAIVRRPEDAEEATCDVYTQIWQSAHLFDASRGSVMAWLMTIARSRALDLLRRNSTRKRLLGEEELAADTRAGPDSWLPDEVLNVFQTGSAVHAALKTVSPERRRIVGLAFFRDLSHTEIAEITGMPIGTVKSHLRRTLLGLRQAIEDTDSL